MSEKKYIETLRIINNIRSVYIYIYVGLTRLIAYPCSSNSSVERDDNLIRMPRYSVAVLATGMLLAGSFNTIATKMQDSVIVGKDTGGNPLLFKHPAWQTALMFAGEALCLLPFFIGRWLKSRGNAGQSTPDAGGSKAGDSTMFRQTFVAFAVPAMCDATATTLLNLGLFYT